MTPWLARMGCWLKEVNLVKGSSAAILLACTLFFAHACPAQEGLRSSIASQLAADSRKSTASSRPYTIKTGDLRWLLTPSVSLDYNDNIDLQSGGGRDDFVLRPALRSTVSYLLTERNLLLVDIGFGYDRYLQHPHYSHWRLTSGSQVSFDIFLEDLWINVHDRFEFHQDSAREASVAATGSYGIFENTAGLFVTWDLNDVKLTAGYDHQNTIATDDSFSQQDHASEILHSRAGLQLQPNLLSGVEGTVSFTSFDEGYLNDSTALSLGLFGEWRPGKAFRFQPRTGYSYYCFQNTSRFIQTADVDGWYLDLTLWHDISAAISYSLNGGHRFRLGTQSDLIEEWYARSTVTWRVFRNITLSIFLGYEHGDQGQGSIQNNLVEDYGWFTAGITANWPIMQRLSVGSHFRTTYRTSNISGRDYIQNLVGLSITYTGE